MINSSKSILDYCAGAGGKSLFMADKIKNKGEIVSYDIYPEKLEELNKRAKRQGITIIETRYPFDNELFDTVIADVPCSGTGTFARNPDAKWRLVESKVEDLIKTGREILEKVKNNVKSGGSLSYITCSLMDMENIEQINWFLSKNKDFELLNQKTIRPSVDMTDGFFIANLLKK
ncbi:MAG: Ribosomal RNA small subunit methyltransferase B [Alphaproteobacteria bacterium ADurb.Bin438]|nr:MAG: Ribosomal RNA small subunit methyltransferase B [Alphaproteobacteria bacterium ADurb.Bin438]